MGNITFNLWDLHEDVNENALCVVLSIHFILAFPANIFILAKSLLFCCSKFKDKSNSHIILVSLALSDLLMTMFYDPLVISTTVSEEWIEGGSESQREIVCDFHGFIYEHSISMSVAALILLSINNFIYIYKPDIFRRIIRATVISAVTVTLWVGLINCPPIIRIILHA